MSSSQTSSQKSVSFPVQFSRCAGLSPGPICCRRSFPAGPASTASRRRWTVSHLGLRFLIFLRTLKTIQTRDFAQPFSLAFQSDALASLSLCLSYINRSYSASFDSLAVLRTDCSIPIDLRIRTTYSAVLFSLERR